MWSRIDICSRRAQMWLLVICIAAGRRCDVPLFRSAGYAEGLDTYGLVAGIFSSCFSLG